MAIKHRLMTFLTAAAVMSVALVTAAGSASASPAAAAKTVATATFSRPVPGLTGGSFIEIDTVKQTVMAGSTAASDCTHNYATDTLSAAPFNWPELAWFEMDTYYCWNGKIVTYHSTRQFGGTTSAGQAALWNYAGTVADSTGWYCYIAGDSSTLCSGNEEYAQGVFTECPIKVGCLPNGEPYIGEWENYRGAAGTN